MHISQYPKPVASGGLHASPSFRPLRSAPAGSVRQPDLGQAPRMGSLLTGFGTGSSAGIAGQGQDADQAAGLLYIRCGPNPGSSGTIQINFAPLSPLTGQYWCAASWATLTSVGGGNLLQVSWTANRVLLPYETLVLAYQWATST